MDKIRQQLFAEQDTAYRDFSCGLIPGAERMIGVRLPRLRAMAREVARNTGAEWVHAMEQRGDKLYFEEVMLWGMVIGSVKVGIGERLAMMERFIPRITNWSLCDSFCMRVAGRDREAVWAFIKPYFRSRATYDVRFAVVMSLKNFTDEQHLEALLAIYPAIRHEDYYVRMGIAWAIAEAFIRFPDRVMQWLSTDCPLDDWVFNKSLQKITESLRVSREQKQKIRSLHRPTIKWKEVGQN